MSCARPDSLANDQLFRQAFADRFASLNSAFSSSPGSEVDFIAVSGPNCQSCQAFNAPARDMHSGAWASAKGASGGNAMHWLLFIAMLVGIVLVMMYIVNQLNKNRKASKVTSIFGAMPKPKVNSDGSGPKGDSKSDSATAGGIKEVKSATEVMPAANDGKLNIIFIHAHWCGYCKQMMPEFKAMAQKYAGKAVFKTVEAEQLKDAKDLTAKLDIKGFPVTVFVRGMDILEKIVGKVDVGTLEAKIKKHAASK